jgi:hypothetical protein
MEARKGGGSASRGRGEQRVAGGQHQGGGGAVDAVGGGLGAVVGQHDDRESGHLDAAADPYAIAVALRGGALMCAWIDQLAGAGQVRGGRDGLIHSLINSAAGPYMTKAAPF